MMIQTLRKVNYHKKLIYMLLEAKTGAVAVNIVGPLFYMFIFYGKVPVNILFILTFMQVFFFMFRIKAGVLLHKSLESDNDESIQKHLKRYLIFIFLNSFIWGVSTFFAVKYGNQLQVFIIMTLVFGMITGSMSSLTPIFHAVFIFVANIITLFILSLLFIGANETYYFVAFFLTVFAFVSIPAAYRIHLSMSDAILKNEEINFLNTQLKERVNVAVKETKRREKLLQEQTRLAQMGEMISMIAHQWRQPLGAISSSVISIQTKKESGKYDLTQEADRDEYFEFSDARLKNINEYVQVLSTTIDDFRNFFKPDKNKELVRLDIPIKRALAIVRSSLSANNIELVTHLDSDEKILMYPNEMMQVILNILKNSEDNFIEKNIHSAKITINTKQVDNQYSIFICDNGGGIPNEILENIFDPYFSTKDEKNGTGLGLYMSKTMIEEHHSGKLSAVNVKNGVCFKISLEISDG